MKTLIKTFLIFSLLLYALSAQAQYPKVTGATTISSQNNVKVTTNNLVKLLKQNNFIIKKQINHQKIAATLGHKIPPVQAVLFGKPDFEYPLIAENPQAALFVPLTFIVWQQHNQTYISYWDPMTDIQPLLNLKTAESIADLKHTSSLLNYIAHQAAKK